MLGLNPATIIARLLILLIAFPIHELAHALMANYLGDLTPRRNGRITLNPIAHLDLFGSILLMFSGFGWAKPVQVNPFNMRGNPRTSMVIVAAVGPISNLLMAALLAIPFQMGLFDMPFIIPGTDLSLSIIVAQFIRINLVLFFFNLIPIPPLDGYKILYGILPLEIAVQLRPLEQYGFLLLVGLIFFLPMMGVDVMNWLVFAPAETAASLLVG